MTNAKIYSEVLRQKFHGQRINHEMFQTPQATILVIDWDGPPFKETWDDLIEWISDNDVLLILASENKYNVGELIIDDAFLSYIYSKIDDAILVSDVNGECNTLQVSPQVDGIFRIMGISEIEVPYE